MARTRQHIGFSVSSVSVILMLLAILAIVGFQGYWLQKNYQDEKANLALRTNVLFQETVQKMQWEKLGLNDSIINFRRQADGRPGTSSFRLVKFRDSTDSNPRIPASVVISMNQTFRTFREDGPTNTADAHPVKSSSVTVRPTAQPGRRIIQLLQGLDSTQDSVRVKNVAERYRQALEKEKLPTHFTIHRSDFTKEELDNGIDMPVNNNVVPVGYRTPFKLEMILEGTTGFILKRLSTQILVSFMLVGLTIFSFVIMYRSMIRQKRLTLLKNDFISNITHELKTPIATVSVAIEALRNFNALHDPERTEEYLNISAGELQRLSLLVDKVLKISMFEKQQIELKNDAFDFNELVEEVIASMRLQFEKYKAKVSIQLHGTGFSVNADRLHISSVIYNLLDNALKYSKANPSIQIDLAALPQHIELSITDNGIGIPPEYKDRIFEKFFRVPTGDTHNVKGYGLGLSYVAYIINRHKGSIEVESQPGIGTRLTIKLPKKA